MVDLETIEGQEGTANVGVTIPNPDEVQAEQQVKTEGWEKRASQQPPALDQIEYDKLRQEISSDFRDDKALAENVGQEYQRTKESELKDDEQFMFAANMFYERTQGEPYKGNPEELVSSTLQDLSFIRDNTVSMAKTLATVGSLSTEEALTLHYLVGKIDATDEDNWQAVKRFGVSVGLDPTTWIGLGAPAFVAKAATRTAGMSGLKLALKKALTPAKIAALEGAVYTGGFVHGEEKISEEAGYGYDATTVAAATGIGAVLGAGAVKGIESIPKVGKELSGFIGRKLDEMESASGAEFITGMQSIMDRRYKSDGLTRTAKKHAKEFGLTDEEIADFDADDFQYFNKASRMIDNMDIQAKKTGDYDPKTIDQEPARPMEEITKELEDWEASQAIEDKGIRKGEVVTAEHDPNIAPYKRPEKPKVEAAKKVLDPKLYATHRTSINNLSKMLDEGVLPAPSFALAKSSKVSEQFGDIVMIPKEKHIDPKKGAYAFGGDAWTPRIKFDPNEEMEIIDLKAPIFDMFPGFKTLAKNAYDKDDFYNIILNEEKYVNWLDKYGANRGFDTYESADRIANQIFKTEKPSLKKKIAQMKKLIKDSGGDIRGLEDAFTPSYIDEYKQYFNLEDVAKRGKELKTFRDKDKFYAEAEKAIKKGEQPPADYMEAKRIDLVPVEDLDRIVVPVNQYDEVVKMFEEKGIKVDIIKQRKGESTNSAIKRSSSGKSNFIWGGASVGLIPLFDKEEDN